MGMGRLTFPSWLWEKVENAKSVSKQSCSWNGHNPSPSREGVGLIGLARELWFGASPLALFSSLSLSLSLSCLSVRCDVSWMSHPWIELAALLVAHGMYTMGIELK